MRISRYARVAWLILAVVVSCACEVLARPDGIEIEGLETELRTRVLSTNPGQTVDLSDMASGFAWSDLVIVGPYPEGDDFRRAAGFDWAVARAAPQTDGSNVLAFVEEGRVVAWSVLRGDIYFLPEEDSSLLVPRSSAVFKVILEDDGESRRLDWTGAG